MPAAPTVVTRQYRGYYRRLSDTLEFQPCGQKTYNVYSTPLGFAQLRERYRFSAPWQGARIFSVFTGAIVTDTATRPGADGDSLKTVRTRFFVASVDSMRAPQSSDCR